MPIVLFNFPTVQLKAYVVQSPVNESNHKKTSYRYDLTEELLPARKLAIEKALSEQKRLYQLAENDDSLAKRISLYLEYIESSPDQTIKPKAKRFYLLDNRENDDFRIHALDFEVALWSAAEHNPPIREIIHDELIFVAIDQLFSELWYFFY